MGGIVEMEEPTTEERVEGLEAELRFWERFAEKAAHPMQAKIARALKVDEEMSPVALARLLDEPLSAVAYHFKVLEGKKIIECARTVPRRGAVEHFYRIREKG